MLYQDTEQVPQLRKSPWNAVPPIKRQMRRILVTHLNHILVLLLGKPPIYAYVLPINVLEIFGFGFGVGDGNGNEFLGSPRLPRPIEEYEGDWKCGEIYELPFGRDTYTYKAHVLTPSAL